MDNAPPYKYIYKNSIYKGIVVDIPINYPLNTGYAPATNRVHVCSKWCTILNEEDLLYVVESINLQEKFTVKPQEIKLIDASGRGYIFGAKIDILENNEKDIDFGRPCLYMYRVFYFDTKLHYIYHLLLNHPPKRMRC